MSGLDSATVVAFIIGAAIAVVGVLFIMYSLKPRREEESPNE